MHSPGANWRRVGQCGVLLASAVVLANCSSAGSKLTRKVDPKYGVSASPRVVQPGEPIPKGGGVYRVGKPYVVGGRSYYPQENRRYRAEGVASWYGDDFHGRLTANGEVYDMNSISAAHPTMPMPSYARVTSLQDGRSIIVRVNDRGPYHSDRVIDLSGKAAELLGFRGRGLAKVRVEYVGPAGLEGSDDRLLLATLRQGQPAPAPSRVMVASAKEFVPQMRDEVPAHRNIVSEVDRKLELGLGQGRRSLAAGDQWQTGSSGAGARNETGEYRLRLNRDNGRLGDVDEDAGPGRGAARAQGLPGRGLY